jgi:ABC-type multidrug transport system fused ATPase/permease subunit
MEFFFDSSSDLDKLREGIGEKLSIFIYLLMSFIISVVFSFFYGWKLTLVILSCAPFIIISTAGESIFEQLSNAIVTHLSSSNYSFCKNAKLIDRKGAESLLSSWISG